MMEDGGRQSRPQTGFGNGRAGCPYKFAPLLARPILNPVVLWVDVDEHGSADYNVDGNEKIEKNEVEQ
jgi:hypothetical protein